MLRLQAFRYKVVYKPGKSNIADPLSRLLSKQTAADDRFSRTTAEYINWIIDHAEPKAVKIKEIEEESKRDPAICAMKDAVYNNDWSELTALYKPFKTEFCFRDDILLRGTKLVIPEALRQKMLTLAHEGHPGMTVMKRRLRSKVWWPKIDEAVETHVKKCRLHHYWSSGPTRTDETYRTSE